MKNVRFAMIGAGGIAQAYAQAFGETANAKLVAVADVRLDAAKAIADSFNTKCFDCYERMAEETEFDAVVVCTPPNTHPEICNWFSSRGVHVLCEKPLAIDSKSAQGMIDTAREANVLLTMASKFRYVDDVVRAKAIVTSGILGDLVLFENTFTSHVDMTSRWNSDPTVSGGGVMIDNGTHSVDIMRYFLGPLAELQVIEGRRVQDLPVEDTVRMFARTPDGVMGSIDLSWSMNKEKSSFIDIYGSNGTVSVGWRESKYRRSSDDEWIIFGNGYNKVHAFVNQLSNFVNAIQGLEALRITSVDAMASVEVIEAAYDSLWRDTWQPVSNLADAVAEEGVTAVNLSEITSK